MATSRTIIVVKHYLVGDFGNALGIADMLSKKIDGHIQILDAHLRSNLLDGLLRRIIRYRQSKKLDPNPTIGARLWPLLFHGALPEQLSGDTLVVSTLGRGEPVAAFLATYWNASAIHLGSLKRMPPSAFAAILSHPGVSAKSGEIELTISPTRIRPGRKITNNCERTKIAVLIGGNAPSIQYSPQSWQRLATYLKSLSDTTNVELHASTSPRTGRTAEHEIRNQLNLHQVEIASFVEYGRNPRKGTEEILADAAVAIVTADSTSMISDAVAKGIPVVAVHDDNINGSQRVSSFVQRLADKKLLLIVNLHSLTNRVELDVSTVVPMAENWSEDIWQQLEGRIPPRTK